MTTEQKCLPNGHGNCFQWGHAVFCHTCKVYVASSYVARYFKKPNWLTKEEIKEFEKMAIND